MVPLPSLVISPPHCAEVEEISETCAVVTKGRVRSGVVKSSLLAVLDIIIIILYKRAEVIL